MEIWQNGGKVPPGVEASTYKVEGIGEDFLPTTTDLSVIDDIIRVTDKESFIWARRLVQEEGIFSGGSSGSALAAAMRYAKRLPAERVVVVILPDSGSRYLSKIFDDKWMREHGYLDADWSEVTLQEVLNTKPLRELICATTTDSMENVIRIMKEHDISQEPALEPGGELAGLVNEVDLLKHMLDPDHAHSSDETVAEIVQSSPPVFGAQARLGEVMGDIVEHGAILVKDGDKLAGIVSKIDLLDFMYG